MDQLNSFLFTITLLFAVLWTTLYGIANSGPRQCCCNIHKGAKLNQGGKQQHLGLQTLVKSNVSGCNGKKNHKITLLCSDDSKDNTWPTEVLVVIPETKALASVLQKNKH